MPMRLQEDAVDVVDVDGFVGGTDGLDQATDAEVAGLAQDAVRGADDEFDVARLTPISRRASVLVPNSQKLLRTQTLHVPLGQPADLPNNPASRITFAERRNSRLFASGFFGECA